MKVGKRNAYLLRKYGITEVQYNQKLKAQKNCCDLCGKHRKNFSRALHVDHDHASGAVRGLLCYYCNRRRVGRLTLPWAKKIYEYFVKHTGGSDVSKTTPG